MCVALSVEVDSEKNGASLTFMCTIVPSCKRPRGRSDRRIMLVSAPNKAKRRENILVMQRNYA